jgi:hypothetical protein
MKKGHLCLPFLMVVAWAYPAAASPTFPPVVDQDLDLTGAMTIEKAAAPPDGCLLCHLTEQGGLGTNNQFGTMMLQNGTAPDEPATLGPALDAVKMIDPRAIQDIIDGINPNDDPAALQSALPVPEYGCAVRSRAERRMNGSMPPWVGLATIGFAAVAFRRRRR